MKTRRKHAPFGETVNPSAFDYTLLNHLYIHDDGNDVIDFGGFTSKLESTHEVQNLLKNRSFMGASVAAVTAASAAAAGPALLHLQGVDAAAMADDVVGPAKARREASRLVSVEDTDTHIWLVTQSSEGRTPYARLFTSVDALLSYARKGGMEMPVHGLKRRLNVRPRSVPANLSAQGEVPFPIPQSRREQGPLPITRWIDIQAVPGDPNASAMLHQLLHCFPLDEATIDNCLYLTPQDVVDTTHLSSRTASYAFFVIACTPLQSLDSSAEGQGTAASQHHLSARQRLGHRFRRRQGDAGEAEFREGAPREAEWCGDEGGSAVPPAGMKSNSKSVMEMRFEAVRRELPRSAVPDPVPVAIVAFADWVITIHEKPFAEMDDLLRIIQVRCGTGPSGATTAGAGGVSAAASPPPQRFTSAFVFTNLLQISIGHHLDSVALAQAVDELGDTVFDVKRSEKEQDHVLQRITAVRRCFGECGADVTRREHIVAALLQPNLAHNFLLRDAGTREQLLDAQAHMRYVQHELSDCRDTVAVSNWYHNVALQWMLLRRGNRALRQLLQLTEMANIMYPVLTIQTLYAMNVPVPFDSEGDPPSKSVVPFYVLSFVIVVYALLCSRAVYRMFKRTPFKTKLLA